MSQSSTQRLVYRAAYQYIGPFFENKLDKFEDLRRALRRAGMDISLRMYLSVSVFYALFGAISAMIFFGLLKFILGLSVIGINLPLTFIPIFGILTGITTYVVRLILPSTRIGERKRKLEASLPTASSYMAAMSSAGVTPDEIFFSLSRDEIGLFVSGDAKKISRDIKVFGLDIIRAIENASRRSPSTKYSSFLEGINATNTSGGDLQAYFENASETLMRDKIQEEKAYVELLGLFAELFLVACIVTPTFAVVLIAMVALQAQMDHTSLVTIVLALAVFLVPILQSMIIILVDGSQPVD
ncbi:MAG: type II secretion system F family protein [Candidatus Kariarchaeaceae archaeon]|jgi:flagellar protein FlaJ